MPSILDLFPAGDNESLARDFLDSLFGYMESDDYEKIRNGGRRPGLHASSIYKTCARQQALIDALGVKPVTAPRRAGNALTQDAGHAMHEWWQNEYLAGSGLLVGEWVCACGKEFGSSVPRPSCCGKVTYRESKVICPVPLNDAGDTSAVYGSCDGIVKFRDEHLVFELKTKSTSGWNNQHAPDPAHIYQVHCYMRGLSISKAIIVYVDRGKLCSWSVKHGEFFAGKPRVKAFLVEFDDEVWSQIETRVKDFEVMSSVKSSFPDALSPDDYTRICGSESCDLARSCPVSEECFKV